MSSAYRRASRIPASGGLTGAQTAAAILREANVAGVPSPGWRGVDRPLLAAGEGAAAEPGGVRGRSLAALGIAAHEAGHAIQDASVTRCWWCGTSWSRWPTSAARSWMLILIGFVLAFTGLI